MRELDCPRCAICEKPVEETGTYGLCRVHAYVAYSTLTREQVLEKEAKEAFAAMAKVDDACSFPGCKKAAEAGARGHLCGLHGVSQKDDPLQFARAAAEASLETEQCLVCRQPAILFGEFAVCRAHEKFQYSHMTRDQIVAYEAGQRDPVKEAQKFDGGKTQLDLFPHEALEEIGKVFTYGAAKYSRMNWRLGMDWSRLYGALLRHLNAWNSGEDKDPESGLPHLAHAGCCVTMLLASQISNLGTDDRWRKP